MIRTHKNKNDDHNNLSFSLRNNLCRLNNFPFTTNYNYAKPQNHYEVADKLPDGAFNRFVESSNRSVMTKKYSVEASNHSVMAINHSVMAINHSVMAINHSVEAIKYNLLQINILQIFRKTIRKQKNT